MSHIIKECGYGYIDVRWHKKQIEMTKHIELPTENEAKKYINELERIDWSQYNGNNLKEYLDLNHQKITSISKVFSTLYLKPPKETKLPFKFFRVRAANQITNRTARCEYSYPPIYFSKNLRANLEGFPVFYASDHPYTAMLEFVDQWNKDSTSYKDQDFVISKWSITNQDSLMFSSFFPEEFKDRN